ncbi:hypothetical protein K3F44_14565 [Pseudomonas sp. S07E 245]|uniref:hypothetical protein n=1 Tax=Pseudomonas sp. S07E 245 TaxID=2866278 RepID=UPI001C7392A0|nr:hypothetical protein [Pseudomonas sp. S07E 245]QYX55231.1 hypothetical protein K3F44_14565 [Pseudomonas sp. S07E 245]
MDSFIINSVLEAWVMATRMRVAEGFRRLLFLAKGDRLLICPTALAAAVDYA